MNLNYTSIESYKDKQVHIILQNPEIYKVWTQLNGTGLNDFTPKTVFTLIAVDDHGLLALPASQTQMTEPFFIPWSVVGFIAPDHQKSEQRGRNVA